MLEDFKPVEIKDKEIFDRYLREDSPETSELTFTNLFIWSHRYNPVWTQWKDCLLVIYHPENSQPFALPPVGTGDKKTALNVLSEQLRKITHDVSICRADGSFVNRYVDKKLFEIIPDRNNSDYVYSVSDLINLSGRKYHRKKNHLNKFLKGYSHEYVEMDIELVEEFISMQEKWCSIRECVKEPELLSEDYAIRTALLNFEELDYRGGAIKIDSRIEAFSLGEPLNSDTAVIHIEKANPDIDGLYAAINQSFCANEWSQFTYINREQDLGIEGLRRAKESYNPHHMVDKFTIIPKNLS